EVKQLQLGGRGRAVIGQVVVKGYEGKINWRDDVQNLEVVLPPRDELPDGTAALQEMNAKIHAAETDEEKQRVFDELTASSKAVLAKQRAFYMTEAGREYFFRNGRYALDFAKDGDGKFRIEDVPGGKYKLKIDLRDNPGGNGMRFNAQQIATIEKE